MSEPRRRRAWALAVFLLALAVRAYFIWRMRASPFAVVPIVDAKEYHDWAKSLIEGRGLLSSYPHHSPLYPLFLAASYRLLGLSPWPVYCLQALLGSLSALLCFQAAWGYSRRLCAAAAAGLAAALAWPFVYWTGCLLPSVLAMSLVSACLWLLSLEETPSWRAALAAGCALGLACSLRPELLLAAAALAGALLWAWRQGTWRACAAFVLAAALLSSAWSLYLASRGMPAFMQAQSGLNFYLGNHPGASGKAADFPGLEYFATRAKAAQAGCVGFKEDDAYFAGLVRAWFRQDPAAVLKLWARKLGLALARCEIPAGEPRPWLVDGSFPLLQRLDFGWLLAFGLPGLLVAAWRRQAFARAVLLFFGAGILALVATASAARYRAPLLPALALGAGYTAMLLLEWAAQRRRLAAAAAVVVSLYFVSARLDALAAVRPERDLGIALSLQARAGGDQAGEARDLLARWSAAHPEDWDAAWDLGLTQAHLKDWPGAEATFRRLAEARGQDWPHLYAYLAWLRALNEDPAGARDAAQAAWRGDPRSLDDCLRAVLYAQWADPAYPASELCRCPLDPADRRPATFAAESLASILLAARVRMDLGTALSSIDEREWEAEAVDYPADELRGLFTRRRAVLVPLSCSR
jgi:hypothetical protein